MMLEEAMSEYAKQLRRGYIKTAYRSIMAFMSQMRAYLQASYPKMQVGSLYPGYMDMTYFSFTPESFKGKNLKVAIVYLHEEQRFEAWLAGSNRKVQKDLIGSLKGMQMGAYKLSEAAPGVDSVVETVLTESPDFDDARRLVSILEEGVLKW